MNVPSQRFKRYALHFLAWLAFGLGMVIAFGLSADPYAFSWPHSHLDPAFRENDLEVRMNIVYRCSRKFRWLVIRARSTDLIHIIPSSAISAYSMPP